VRALIEPTAAPLVCAFFPTQLLRLEKPAKFGLLRFVVHQRWKAARVFIYNEACAAAYNNKKYPQESNSIMSISRGSPARCHHGQRHSGAHAAAAETDERGAVGLLCLLSGRGVTCTLAHATERRHPITTRATIHNSNAQSPTMTTSPWSSALCTLSKALSVASGSPATVLDSNARNDKVDGASEGASAATITPLTVGTGSGSSSVEGQSQKPHWRTTSTLEDTTGTVRAQTLESATGALDAAPNTSTHPWRKTWHWSCALAAHRRPKCSRRLGGRRWARTWKTRAFRRLE